MKCINKFIALGLGMSLTFTSGCLTYGYFANTAKQDNNISFDVKSVVLRVNVSDSKYITPAWFGNEVIKFGYSLDDDEKVLHRQLYPGEEIVLEITDDSANIFKGAKVTLENGYIKMEKGSFYKLGDWDIIGEKRTVGLKAYIKGLDGKIRNAWPNNKNIRYFEVELKNYTTSPIDLGEVNIIEVNRISFKDYSSEEINQSEEGLPSQPEVVKPPKEEVSQPEEEELPEYNQPETTELETIEQESDNENIQE